MILTLLDDKLRIEWEWWEQLWGINFEKVWDIPLSHIQDATADRPSFCWWEIRAPGTFVPALIKAGTYYTERGKEFWYATNNGNFLVLELREEEFVRIVLTLEEHELWKSRITERL